VLVARGLRDGVEALGRLHKSLSPFWVLPSFVYGLNGQMFRTTASSVTLAATDGVAYSVKVAIKNAALQVGPYSELLSVTPKGSPAISSTSVTGKVITVSFSPNGSPIAS